MLEFMASLAKKFNFDRDSCLHRFLVNTDKEGDMLCAHIKNKCRIDYISCCRIFRDSFKVILIPCIDFQVGCVIALMSH